MWIAILAHRIGLDFVRSPFQHSPSSSSSLSCAASARLTSAGLGQRIIMRLRPGILCTRPLEPRLLNRGCSRQMACRGKWGHRVSPIPDRIRSGLPGTEVGVGLVMSQISPLGPLNSHHRRTLELILQKGPASFRILLNPSGFSGSYPAQPCTSRALWCSMTLPYFHAPSNKVDLSLSPILRIDARLNTPYFSPLQSPTHMHP